MNPGVGIPITTDIFYIEIPIAMLCQKGVIKRVNMNKPVYICMFWLLI